jgi:hypothetical protein
MAARRVCAGITSIIRTLPKKCIASASLHASGVEKCISDPLRKPVVSAQKVASPSRAMRLALTMKNAIARFAAKLSWLIATSTSKPARENAGARCLAIRDAGRADVYCLTVPGISAFCVEGGLVVHNTRYLAISGIARAAQRPSDEWAKTLTRSVHQFEYEPYAEAFKIQGV